MVQVSTPKQLTGMAFNKRHGTKAAKKPTDLPPLSLSLAQSASLECCHWDRGLRSVPPHCRHWQCRHLQADGATVTVTILYSKIRTPHVQYTSKCRWGSGLSYQRSQGWAQPSCEQDRPCWRQSSAASSALWRLKPCMERWGNECAKVITSSFSSSTVTCPSYIELHSSCADTQKDAPSLDVWWPNIDLPVKPAWSQQGIVQDVNTVGGSQNHNISLGWETCRGRWTLANWHPPRLLSTWRAWHGQKVKGTTHHPSQPVADSVYFPAHCDLQNSCHLVCGQQHQSHQWRECMERFFLLEQTYPAPEISNGIKFKVTVVTNW